MAILNVTTTHDYSVDNLAGVTDINFVLDDERLEATFDASQFNDIQISRSIRLHGAYRQSFGPFMNVVNAHNFSADTWFSDVTGFGFRIYFSGTTDADVITGSRYNDSIESGDGADQLFGGDGNDSLGGDDGDDQIYGGTGNDQLAGDVGRDQLYGGEGNDIIQMTDGANDTVSGEIFDGGDGYDELICLQLANGLIDLSVDTITGVEELDLRGAVRISSDQLGPEAIHKIVFLNHAAVLTVTGRSTDLSGYGDPAQPNNGSFILNGSATFANNLIGSKINDTINSASRADTLSGGAGDDRINAGNGNDLLSGDAGNDILDGGDAIDVASYDSASIGVTVSLAISGSQDTIGAGTDTLLNIEGLTGSNFEDRLTGNVGNNTLHGGGGNDVLSGDEGSDTLIGDAGDDLLDGGIGTFADTFDGGDGVDTVTYQAITTGVGVHVDLSVSGPQNTVAGGSDSFVSIENLIGTTTNDTLIGSDANNLIDGGGGATDNDVLNGGGGIDTVTYARATAGVTVSLADGVADGGGGHDQLAAFENVVGSAYADTITGTAGGRFGNGGGNVLDGGAGVDTLIGLAGNDTYILSSTARIVEGGIPRTTYDIIREEADGGTDTVLITRAGIATYSLAVNVENAIVQGPGAMTLFGNASNNVLTGNEGDDTLIGRGGDDTLNGGGGSDTANYASESAGVGIDLALTTAQDLGAAGKDTLVSIENLDGSAFADRLVGNAVANRLSGGDGADRLDGRDANDVLNGGAGNDRLTGGTGQDAMTGGDGDDTYSVNDGGDTTIELANGGYDTVNANIDWTLSAETEKLVLSGRAAAGTGNALDNIILGSARANTLAGLDGDDVLQGGAGNDMLDGGAGSDNLVGGADRDTLTGGAGRDRFTFLAGDTGATTKLADLITDFSHADRDRISLLAIDANAASPTDDAFTFIGTAAFGHVAGQLRYEFVGRDTYVQADSDGDGTADLMIRLTGHVALVASDFIL